jgi:hypothetical protein
MAVGPVRRVVCRIAPVLVAIGILAACTGDGDASKPEEDRVAAVYGAVILAVAGGHQADEAPPVVFAVPRSDAKSIPLPVQAAVVDDLANEVSVRFVDADDEAIDSTVEDRPVKEGVLLRLGPVPPTGDPVELTADRYRTMTDQELLTLSVRSNGETWSARVIAEAPLAPAG